MGIHSIGFTDSDAERFLVEAMREEKGEVRQTFFSWIRIARKCGIRLFFRMLLTRYLEWLEYHAAGSIWSFFSAFDIREFIHSMLRSNRERQKLYVATFSSALH